MSMFTISLDLEPYLSQWFIHEHGGAQPVTLARGSAESDILELFLTKQPEAVPQLPGDNETQIYIPTFKYKEVRTFNFLPLHAKMALKHVIRNRFIVQMWNDLHKFEYQSLRNDHLIYAWMEAHGIECTETNWCAIYKIYYRKRKTYLTLKSQKKRSDLKQ